MSLPVDYKYEIDVAHPPRHPDRVEEALNDALSHVRSSCQYRAIKVIHGYGSHGRGGTTKETVRNWAFRFRRHFDHIIEGENYSLFDDTTQAMRDDCGRIDDEDLDAANPGITILWVK